MRTPRRLFGLDLDETIAGGAEPERIAGRGGADLITGGEGDDALRGNRGDDTLVGGEGDDTLAGGSGSDLLVGGAGRDLFRFVANGGGRDTVEGYSATEDALRFDGYDDVIVRVMSDTEAWITFGAGLAGEAVLLRAAPGGPAGAFALGDLAVSNDLRIEIAAGVNLLVPEGETFSAAGDLVIVFEGDAPVTPAGGGLGVNASGTPGGGAVTTGSGGVVVMPGGGIMLRDGILTLGDSGRVLIAGSGAVVLPAEFGSSLGGGLVSADTSQLPTADGVVRVTNASAPREGGFLSATSEAADSAAPVAIESWPSPPDEAPLL